MNKLDIATKAVKFIAASTTSFAVSRAIRSTAVTNNALENAEVLVGGFIVGWMVGDAAEKFVEQKINETIAKVNEDKQTK